MFTRMVLPKNKALLISKGLSFSHIIGLGDLRANCRLLVCIIFKAYFHVVILFSFNYLKDLIETCEMRLLTSGFWRK
jgi:hypothetical protein